MIDSVRLFVVLMFFGYAAYCDYKTRSVENWVWTVSGTVGLVVQETLVLLYDLPLPIWSIVVSVVFALIMWYFGLFGGADSKGLIALSLLVPVGFSNETPFFPLVVFLFSCVSSFPYLVYLRIKGKFSSKVELPFLVFFLFGIVISVFVGDWFVGLFS